MRCSRRETSASKLCVLAASLVGVWASAVKWSLSKNVGRGIPAETARRSGYRDADASMQARNQALAGGIMRAATLTSSGAPAGHSRPRAPATPLRRRRIRGSMHEGERAGGKRCEAADRGSHAWIETRIVEQVLRCDRGTDDVPRSQGGPVAELGEKVAAEKRARTFLVQDPSVPSVWDVRRVNIADPLSAAEVDDFVIGQNSRRPVGHVVEGDERAGLPMPDLGVRGGGGPF